MKNRAMVGAGLTALATVGLPGAARAATFTVTNTSDTEAGSFRDAVTQANAAAGPHVINITATGVVDLATALPALTQPVVINGPGAANFKLLRKPERPQFTLLRSQSSLEIHGMTFEGGEATLFGVSCIEVGLGTFVLDASSVTGCKGSNGDPVIRSSAVTTIRQSRFTANSGYAVLYLSSQGATNVVETTIEGNSATAIVFPPAGG